jgi:hypothetical protein
LYFLALEPPSAADRERQRQRGDIRVLDEVRQRHLWKMDVADGRDTRITSGTDYVYAFKIAANGTRVVISRRPTQLPADSDKMELWSIAADGTAPIRLTNNAVPEEDGWREQTTSRNRTTTRISFSFLPAAARYVRSCRSFSMRCCAPDGLPTASPSG